MPAVQSAPKSRMKTVLVVGSTGQQGSSVVKALSESGRYFCLALTRNLETPKAKRIAALENVQLVSADLDDEPQLRSVFVEAIQSGTIASIAAEFNVQSYVYSSVIKYLPDEQHAPARGSDRYAKASIEKHVQTMGYSWTIIRPGFFMENLGQGMIGRLTDGALRYSGSRVQFIAVNDIGLVACAIFNEPSKFTQKILDVAGDSLTSEERSQAFIRATGHDIPGVPSLLIAALYRLNGDVQQIINELRLSDETRRQDPNGHDANIQEVAKHVRLTTFEEWARKRIPGNEENASTHGVTLLGLILGR